MKLTYVLLVLMTIAGEVSADTLNLQQALDLAYARNPDLQAAAERIGQAEAQVSEALAAFYPKLTGRVGYGYSNDPAVAFSSIISQRRFNQSHFDNINQPGFTENFRPELVGTLSLFRGGTDYYRQKAAELGVEVAELERSGFRNRLAAAVSAAFYAALAAPQQLQAALRSEEAVESELKHARIAHEVGTLLKSDVLSLEVRQAQAKEAELRARNAVDLTRSGLKTLLGLGAADTLEILDGGDATPAASGELPALIEQALAQRPEMLASAQQVEIRTRELRAEQGGHLPRVNAYAAYGLNERSPEFDFQRDNLTLAVNAEVDLFAGGATSARIEGARRRLAESQALREGTRLEIEDEVQKAFATRREAEARQTVAEAASAAATEAFRLVQEQYRQGTATVTRYLEAEADRTQAETHAVLARFETRTAQANLHKAIGYWK
ncbi:MAG TPA: TolC family protein [Methylococcaceae bacterium]|nr:TolC family protein [Methylococcaceae bacterium]